jgi:DNA ligase (NAD+)
MTNTKGVQMTKQELVDLIIKEDLAYRKGDPIVSDPTFELHMQMLREMDPNHWILQKSGRISQPIGTKVKHPIYPIETIKTRIKAFNLLKEFEKIPSKTLAYEPKYDGGSAIVYYTKGVMDRILTGSEEYDGVDVTENLKHAVPTILPMPLTIAIGGEYIITNEDFEETFKPLGKANARNAATGLIQSEHVDKELVKKLRFIACYVIGIDFENSMMEYQPMTFVELPELSFTKLGFEEVPKVYLTRDAFLEMAKDFVNMNSKLFKLKDGKTFLYDGLVIKDYRYKTKAKCGNWSLLDLTTEIAYKFEEESALTKIEGIEYNMSRTGRLVPTLLVKPTVLSGVTIRRVTGNNISFIKDKKAGVGAQVRIVRSNEVIPKLEEVIIPSGNFNIPTRCEYCGSELTVQGVDLVCTNLHCQAKTVEMIYRLLEIVMDTKRIDGIGRELIDKLLEEGRVDSFEDFIEWFYNDDIFHITEFAFGLHTKTCEKFDNVISEIKDYVPTISQVLLIANIPSIGDKVARNFNNVLPIQFVQVFRDNLPLPKEWDQFTVNYLNLGNLDLYRDRVNQVLQFFGWQLQGAVKIQKEVKVAVTGSVSIPRDRWFKEMSGYGIIESGVSKGTQYLVCNNPSNSSKFEKAKKLGIKIISEEDFYTELGIPGV